MLAGFIESWGRGIEKICEACASEGCPMPEFMVNPEDIMVKFTAAKEQVVHEPQGVIDGITERETKMLELLYEDPGYSYSELAEKLSVSRKTVSERMKELKEKKIIERVGTTKKGYWKILK